MRPDSEDILRLFPAHRVAASSGAVGPATVDELDALSPREIPSGFDRWVEKRQREYRAGRHHAHQALGDIGAAPLVLRGQDGLPIFPEGTRGSITHTGKETTFAAAVVTREALSLGLDIELVRPLNPSMCELILTDEERVHAPQVVPQIADEWELQHFALLCFSAKESVYKCVYPRCRTMLGFHDLRLWFRPENRSFVATIDHHDKNVVPERLEGRYFISRALVASGVAWPDAETPSERSFTDSASATGAREPR